MRVLHLFDHSLPTVDGYSIRSAAILRFQAAVGIEPLAITSPHHAGPLDGEAEVIEGQLYERIVGDRGRVPFLREGLAVRRCARGVAARLADLRPDVLHAHSPALWGLAALRAAGRRGSSWVYEVRGSWEDAAVEQGRTRTGSLRYRLSRFLETFVCRRAQRVVVLSRALADDLASRGLPRSRMVLVPNGVETALFRPRPPDPELAARWAARGRVVGYFGSLLPPEGVEDLLEAVTALGEGGESRVTLLVGGSGKLAGKLERWAAQTRGARARVVFLGVVPHSDVPSYYSICDLVAFPRRSTPTTERVSPLKPLEAMAMGLPIVASDVGGLRELLPEGTAQFVPPGDPVALANACRNLLADPERRAGLGHRARCHAVEHHDWRQQAERYVEMYRQLEVSERA